MSTPQLKDVYKSLEKKSVNEIFGLINAELGVVLPMLKKYGPETSRIFAGYIFAVAGADGRLKNEEFLIIKPLMDVTLNMDSTMKDAKELIFDYGFDSREIREEFIRILDAFEKDDPELKFRMILLAMYVSAIDGNVSRKERAFIESLI